MPGREKRCCCRRRFSADESSCCRAVGRRRSGRRSGRAVRPHSRSGGRGAENRGRPIVPPDEARRAGGVSPLILDENQGADAPRSPDLEVLSVPRFERPLEASVREARLLCETPWVRTLGRIDIAVSTEGWKFPAPPLAAPPQPARSRNRLLLRRFPIPKKPTRSHTSALSRRPRPSTSRIGCSTCCSRRSKTSSTAGNSKLPFEPFPYQLKGIAFLMPRHCRPARRRNGPGQDRSGHPRLRLLFHQRA